jgi:anti-sigma factor RsiW
MSDHRGIALPELHLAVEAVVAHVDGELAPVPRDRANAHLAGCAECRAAVAEQRRAKAALTVAPGPAPSNDLLARLRDIPMTTDLTPPGMVLAVQDDQLVYGTAASVAPRGRAKRAARKTTRTRPAESRPASKSVHRISRSFAGVAAAAVVGILAASATTTSTSTGTGSPSRQVAPQNQQPGTQISRSTSLPGSSQLVDTTNALFGQTRARQLSAARP